MISVFLDFEIRSLADLGRVGAWKYAAHSSTYPLMLAALFDDGRRLQWLEYQHGRNCPDWVRQIAESDIECHAHSAMFEMAIWQRVLVERWGWPTIPVGRWHDTAALAAHANRPRGLEKVAALVGAKVQKDTRGDMLKKAISMPRKSVKAKKDKQGNPRKDNRDFLLSKGVELFAKDADEGAVWYWEVDTRLFRQFEQYNETDVVAEREVHYLLPPYSWREQDVWELDARINERGVPIDRQLCEAAIELQEHEAARAEIGLQTLTDGAVTKPTQNQRMIKWIAERCPGFGKSMAKEHVAAWLANYVDTAANRQVKELLEYRDIAGGAAIKKYQAALDCADTDDRARGQLLYYGAATGRWAGKGIQVHNFAREKTPDDWVVDLVKTADPETVGAYCRQEDTSITELLKKCVRGLVVAPKGKKFIVSDFAGIEARVLQWLAGDETVLDMFRSGRDVYVRAASQIYGLSYEQMTDDKGHCLPGYKAERQVGKIAQLALGYGMGAQKYSMTCKTQAGLDIEPEFAQQVVSKWREANPLVVQLWYRMEKAVKAVVRNPKIVARVRNEQGHGVRVSYDSRDYICVELPSTRRLYYPKTRLIKSNDGWGPRIQYQDGTKGRIETYGGSLVENLCQAIARDLLVEAMFAIDKAGLPVIMHVHDEVVCEVDEDDEQAKQIVHDALTIVPRWAEGLPLDAETHEMRRFSK